VALMRLPEKLRPHIATCPTADPHAEIMRRTSSKLEV